MAIARGCITPTNTVKVCCAVNPQHDLLPLSSHTRYRTNLPHESDSDVTIVSSVEIGTVEQPGQSPWTLRMSELYPLSDMQTS